MNIEKKIGILGCGNMGEAIARAAIHSDIINAGGLYLCDIDKNKAKQLGSCLNANISNSSRELCGECNIIIFAVKPQDMEDVLRECGGAIDSSKVIVSIAAGFATYKIGRFIEDRVGIIRVMPNIALFVNAGTSAVCHNDYVSAEDVKFIKELFMATGEVVEVEESLMDVVTAVSASGPAYFFYLAEILERYAIEKGIESSKAKALAVNTAMGSALLMREGENSAEALRKRVTSKGGTTEAAFKYFAEHKLSDILKGGVDAARKRAKELSGD